MRIFILSLYLFLLHTAIGSGQMTVQYRTCIGCTELDANDSSNGNFSYGAVNDFRTNQVASDFGPRRRGADHYDWHGGVDYTSGGGNSDRGDLLIAINDGTLEWDMDNEYKYMIIDGNQNDFGYGHLFRTSTDFPLQSGSCVLKYMIPPNQNRLALIIPTINADTISGYEAIAIVR